MVSDFFGEFPIMSGSGEVSRNGFAVNIIIRFEF